MSKLGDHIEYVKGFAFKSKDYTETGIPVIRVSNFTDNSIDIKDVYHIPKERFSEFQKVNLIKDDIVIATVGSWPTNPSSVVGKTIRVPPEANNTLLNQNAVRIRSLDKDEQLYFYYVLKDKSFSDYIISTAQGSANQASITLKSILDYDLPNIDSKEKRIKIGKTLATYDEKIQLNTQINQTLEQIAQALFKSWFIDFDPVRAKVQALSDGLSLEQAELAAMQAISGKTAEELTALSQAQSERYAELAETAKVFPCEIVEVDGIEVPRGWEIKPLPEIIDFLEGPGIRNWQYTDEEDGIKFINIRCIQNGDLTLTTANKITKEEAFGKYKHFQLEEDDIVVSTSGTLGRFAFVRKEHLPLSLNTSVIRFRPIKNKSTLGFIAGFVENQLQHELEIRASGSAQRNFGPTHLKQISLLVPDFKLLELHQKYASSLFEKRKQLLSEIDVLKDTRDLLLPKLLNGEI